MANGGAGGEASQDFVGISRRSSVYLVGLVASRSVGFLLVPLFTRLMDTTEYGILSAIGALSSVLAIFYTFGLRGAFARFYWDDYQSREELGRLLGTVLAFTIALSVLATCSLYFGGRGLMARVLPSVPFEPYVQMGLALAMFSVLPPFWTTYCRMREKATLYVVFTTGSFIVTTALSVYLVAFLGQGALGRLRSQVAVQAVLSVLALVLLGRGLTLGMSFRKLRASLRYGLAYLPHNLSGWIMGLLDRLILGGLSGFSTVGIYNVGYTLGGVMGMIAVAFNLAYTPYFMKKVQQQGGPEAARTIARVATSWFNVMVFLALGISMFAREMVYVMAAGSYQEAWRVIPIIVLAFLCQGTYFLVVKPIIQSKRYIRYLPIGSFSGGMINLLGNALLIPRFGMMGAAWATLMSYFAMMGIAYTLSRRALRIPYEYTKAARSLAIGFGLFFATDLLHATTLPWWMPIVVKAVSLASYPLLLMLSGVLRWRDLTAASSIIVRSISQRKRARKNPVEADDDSGGFET